MGDVLKLILALAIAFVVQLPAARTASADADDDDGCLPSLPRIAFDKKPKLIDRPPLTYPGGQANVLGEGWVWLSFAVSADGTPSEPRVIEAVGLEPYVEVAVTGWRTARYEPAVLRGQPTAMQEATAEVSFMIEGENRAGTHPKFDLSYDRAYMLRQAGRPLEAVPILKDALKTPLNLYEIATLSYGLAFTYNMLGDRHRALRYIGRALLDDGVYVDKGLRRAAFAMGIELAAQDNDVSGVCWYKSFVKQYPDAKSDRRLFDIVDALRQRATGIGRLRTEVELTESDHARVPVSWRHLLLRRSAVLTPLSGSVREARVDCQTTGWSKPVGNRLEISLPPTESCDLTVFGEAGARFTLDEG